MNISEENKLQHILDFDKCKQMIQDAKDKGETMVILCPHYSINVQSKYEDGEDLSHDLDELNDYLEEFTEVSDFDDLVVYLDYGGDDDGEAKYFRNNTWNGANLD